MRRPRSLTFDCGSCGTVHERLVETGDDGQPLAEETCGLPLEYAKQPQRCAGILVVRNIELAAAVVRDGRTALDRCKS